MQMKDPFKKEQKNNNKKKIALVVVLRGPFYSRMNYV